MVREFLLTIKHPVHPISRSANVRTYEIWKVIKWYSGTLLIVISKDTWLLEVTDSEVLQYECLSDDYETRSHCLMKKIWNNHWLFLGWRSSPSSSFLGWRSSPSSSMSSPSPSSSRSSCQLFTRWAHLHLLLLVPAVYTSSRRNDQRPSHWLHFIFSFQLLSKRQKHGKYLESKV